MTPRPASELAARLRVFEPQDFERAYRLDKACYPPGIAYPRFVLASFLAEPGAQAWVAETAGRKGLAGFALARKRSGAHGHIVTLEVRAGLRRRGIGRALLIAAEDWLAQQGARFIWLETAVDNEPAVAFWKQAGYEITGTLPAYYLDRTDAHRMKKDLTSAG